MPEILVDNTASEIVADCLAALMAATVSGQTVFASAISVNDVESFLRVSDPLSDTKPRLGIVEGSIEQRNGTADIEPALCRLPLDLLIKFKYVRNPGDGEQAAMVLAKRYLQIAKKSLMVDPSRGGRANLLMWGGEVVNGTSVSGVLRPIIRRTNEAFFAAAASVAVCWISGV